MRLCPVPVRNTLLVSSYPKRCFTNFTSNVLKSSSTSTHVKYQHFFRASGLDHEPFASLNERVDRAHYIYWYASGTNQVLNSWNRNHSTVVTSQDLVALFLHEKHKVYAI